MDLTRVKAEAADSPAAAAAVWQDFVDHNPQSPDLGAAQDELTKWKALASTGAEKINGRWVGGNDLRDVQSRASEMIIEARELLRNAQTIKAIAKLKEAAAVYPNSTEVNYLLGNLAMEQRKYDDALRYFETNARLRPDSAEAVADVGVTLVFKGQWVRSIETLQHALELKDSQPIVQDMVDALTLAPPAMRNNDKVKAAADSIGILQTKYQIAGATKTFLLVPPRPPGAAAPAEDPTAGAAWSGSGFVISPTGSSSPTDTSSRAARRWPC